MKAPIMNFFKNEEGLETVEWGVMLFLIIGGLIAIVALLGDQVEAIFTTVTDAFTGEGVVVP
jgi:pilus assembly protein Flp/PilA